MLWSMGEIVVLFRWERWDDLFVVALGRNRRITQVRILLVDGRRIRLYIDVIGLDIGLGNLMLDV